MRRYDISKETYRKQFRATQCQPNETALDVRTRLNDLACKWTKEATSREDLLDLIVAEQLLNVLPREVQMHVTERSPTSSHEVAQFADSYCTAHEIDLLKKNSARCGRDNHKTQNCRDGQLVNKPKDGSSGKETIQLLQTSQRASRSQQQGIWKRDNGGIQCYACGKLSHIARECPGTAFVEEGRPSAYYCEKPVTQENHSLRREQQNTTAPSVRTNDSFIRSGLVNGKYVEDLVVDTGCSQTILHANLVPRERYVEGKSVKLRCAHGDIVTYPIADVELLVDDCLMEIQAAVSETLPESALLGKYIPGITQLLSSSVQDVLAVTRAQHRQQEAECKLRMEREVADSATSKSVIVDAKEGGGSDDAEHDDLTSDVDSLDSEHSMDSDSLVFTFDDDLFGGGRGHEKFRLTRRQRRRQREGEPGVVTELSGRDSQRLQRADSSLSVGWKAASELKSGFCEEDGLLYHQAKDNFSESNETMQLVLPFSCRKLVLHLAHTVPLAGHLGSAKTTQRILTRLYWPTVYRDVRDFCRSCPECQKSSKQRTVRAPLVPLPIIDEPFSRLAMDIIGPLPRSARGHRYILVICDYTYRINPELEGLWEINTRINTEPKARCLFGYLFPINQTAKGLFLIPT